MKHLSLYLVCSVILLVGGVACCPFFTQAQGVTNVDTYTNPVIHADYSDPDVIAVGNDFYMTASSFNAVPGLPLLHSKDLVHWKLMGYALQQLYPVDSFALPQHGKGVWAPAIRFHKDRFYIFYPDPDVGIYMIQSKHISGPWSAPVLVEAGKGLIDPCPLWDEDGRVYLVHAFAGSRAGFKSVLVIKELNAAADKVIGNGVLVFDGHGQDPTVEGPKLYKRNGYYYIFAPAGGVATGWQLVLRSKHIYGPYERKVVLQQGTTSVNGPHQGAWVHTAAGEDWFCHFQDKAAYGRVVHLQPMRWRNNWPELGTEGNGMPVDSYRMPKVPAHHLQKGLVASDECNDATIAAQWQWQANPKAGWAFCSPAYGAMRLNAIRTNSAQSNLWMLPNWLLQKFPSVAFRAVTKLSFAPHTIGERLNFAVMGLDYAGIALLQRADGLNVCSFSCLKAAEGTAEQLELIAPVRAGSFYLALTVATGAVCKFEYSMDGVQFFSVGTPFNASPGKWVGAKFGFSCTSTALTNDAGYADIDWIRVQQQ